MQQIYLKDCIQYSTPNSEDIESKVSDMYTLVDSL